MSENTQTLDAAQIATHPDEYGIRWSSETVQRKESGNVKYPAEIPVIVDLGKARAWLTDGRILGWLDGSSLRIKIQGVHRNGPGFKKDQATQRVIAIKAMLDTLEAETKVVTKFVALVDGELMEFNSKEEAEQFLQELAQPQA